MRFAMPAAVLAGGASRRMGSPKPALSYGPSTLLAHQTRRMATLFEYVFVVVKEAPSFDAGPARVVLDQTAELAPIHGLLAALEQTLDRVFVLAVDLPLLADAVIREIAGRGLETESMALLPRSNGLLQPLAAVWRRAVLPQARARIARGELSLHGLAERVGAEILEETDWRRFDPSGDPFANVNTLEEYAATRDRA